MCLKKSPDLPAQFQPHLTQGTLLESTLICSVFRCSKLIFDKFQPISFDLHYSEEGYTVCCPEYAWNDRVKRCKR